MSRAWPLLLILIAGVAFAAMLLPARQRPPAGEHAVAESPADAANGRDEKSGATARVEEHWQSIFVGDARIGSLHTVVEPLAATESLPARIRTKLQTSMTVKRFGQSLTTTVLQTTTETHDGRMLDFEYAMGTSPAATTKSSGTVQGDTLKIETTVAGTTTSRSIAWDDDVKSPVWQERLLRTQKLETGDRRTFRCFIPDQGEISEMSMTVGDVQPVALPGGSTQSLRKVTVSQSLLPTLPMTAWLDEEGTIVLIESDLSGQTFRMLDVPQAVAEQTAPTSELDLAIQSLIPASPLDRPHETQRVAYRIHVPGHDAAKIFVDGGTQQVERIDRETVQVTVTRVPVTPQSARGPADAEYTAPATLIQSNDDAVRGHLAKAVTPDQPDGLAAVALERYVHEKLATKNFTTAFASAAEVARSLEGDCSEHAVLLAALLRARGIPARIVVGIVFVPGKASMGGHVWTEARLEDGWIPLDATLGRGGIGGGHLKIAHSSLAEGAPLPVATFAPLLNLGPDTTIEVVRVER